MHVNGLRHYCVATDALQRRDVEIPTASGGFTLSASLLYPSKRTNRAVVLVHGFGAEKTENGLFDPIAKALANQGMLVVQYDWRGLGGSSGHFGETSLEQHVDDLFSVQRWTQAQWGKDRLALSALGFSLGAGILTMAVAQGLPLSSAVFVSPAIRLQHDMWPRYSGLLEKILGREMKTVLKPARFVGNPVWLGLPILSSLQNDLSGYLESLTIPVLACHGTEDARISINSTRALFGNAAAPWSYREFPGASHSFRSEDHRGELVSVICDWFLKRSRQQKRAPQATSEHY